VELIDIEKASKKHLKAGILSIGVGSGHISELVQGKGVGSGKSISGSIAL
jgi:hypothetical protein